MEQKSKEIKLVIYGNPVPQGRPKFARVGNHVNTYDPQKSRNYKQLVKMWATNQLKKIAGFTPFKNAICVRMDFYVGIPTSWNKKKRMDAACGLIRPTVRNGDLDNMYKAVTDALNGLAWTDDSIITDANIHKRYTAETARVEVWICEVQ